MQVRPYREADREQVRRIAFETGYMGEPCDWYWRDATGSMHAQLMLRGLGAR